MHEVQAFTRFGVPPTTVRTRWMFGFQRRDVRRCECEMLLPKPGPLPQTSQLAATGVTPKTIRIARTFTCRQVPGNRGRVTDERVGKPIRGTEAAHRPRASGRTRHASRQA